MTASEVLALLESPPPVGREIAEQLAALVDERAPLAAWPDPGSRLETGLLKCAILMFLGAHESEPCQAEVRRLLGPVTYSHLIEFLCYVKTCFLWVESHPELAYEADRRAQDHLGPLLDAEPPSAGVLSHVSRPRQARTPTARKHGRLIDTRLLA